MSSAANLLVKFLLELAALAALGYWGRTVVGALSVGPRGLRDAGARGGRGPWKPASLRR
jgi:hypothetical protein